MMNLLVLLFATGDVIAATFTLSPEYSYVVKDDQLQLNCSSSEANTSIQIFQWWISKYQTRAYIIANECSATGVFSDKTNYKVTCTDTWSSVLFKNITRNQTGIYWLCNSFQQQQSRSNSAYVLYTVPVESVEMESHADNMAIVENSSTTFRCQTSKSLPAPRIFWFLVRPGFPQINITEAANQTPPAGGGIIATTVKSDLNYLFNRSFNGWQLYCMATNTHGQYVKSSMTELNILYPPDINEMKNSSAVEGSTFSILCPVLLGNPSNQTVRWKNEGNNFISGSAMLSIQNVSRDDGMMYTCVVSYTMKPTGDIEVVGEVSKSFYLTVFYRTDITKFTTTDLQTDTDVIVNMSDTVQLRCAVDSNPDSNISIVFNTKVVERAVESKRLTYNITKVDCSDAGVYTCIGGNEYNHGHMARANLTMFVKCKPKPSVVSRPIQTIRSALNMSATLKFTAASYLDPGETSFMWMRQREHEWMPLRNNKNIIITTYDLQSSLTIISAATTDFGEYLLVYNNSIGSSNLTFNLVVSASSSRQQNVVDSSNTTAFVAVGAGASVTTLIIGAVVFISYRRLRRRSAQSQKVENNPQNQTASTYMNMKTYDGIGEYEEIQMSKAVENKTENVGNQTGTSGETESSLQYERIDNTKQETNLYSQLQGTSESRADTARETDKEIHTDNDKTILTESDYVNMRI